MTPLPSPEEWRPGFAKRADNFEAVVQRAAAWRWEPGVTIWRVEDAVMLGTSDLKPIERLVLLHYVRRLNQEKLESDIACVWPSTARIAMEIEISSNTLRAHRRTLEAKGYMVRDYNRANRPADVEAYDLAPLMARLGELEEIAARKDQAFLAERARKAEHVVAFRNSGAQASNSRRLEQSHNNEVESVQRAAAPTARDSSTELGAKRAQPLKSRGSSPELTTNGPASANGSPKRASFAAAPSSSADVSAEMVREEIAAALELSPAVAALVPSPVRLDPAGEHVFDASSLAQAAAALLPASGRNNDDTFRWGLARHGVRVFTMLAIALEDPLVNDPAKYFGRLVSQELSRTLDLRFNLRRIAAKRGLVTQRAFAAAPSPTPAADSLMAAPGQDTAEWRALAFEIERMVKAGAFGSWFSRCGYHGVEAGVLRLSTPNSIARDRIRSNYLAELCDAGRLAGLPTFASIEIWVRKTQ